MSATLNFLSIKTVPSNYSWDKDGVPVGTTIPFITATQMLTSSSTNSEGMEYFGYAPLVSLSLSSAAGTVSPSAVAIRRIVDFGDYYNSEFNSTVSPTLSDEVYCHNYVMPGLYSVKLIRNEYILVEEQSNNDNVYVQPLEQRERFPLSWQWYNFLCESPSPYNTPTTWEQAQFQQSGELTWAEAYGPCYSQLSWTWNTVTSSTNVSPFAHSTTWNDTECDSALNTTWLSISATACQSSTTQYTISSVTETIEKDLYLRVLEIPPKCYLATINAPTNKISPYTVQLSPRYTKCGSFPIEKIVWDLGDGSPLLVQRRIAPNSTPPFIYTGVFNLDWKDPRNYDIIHTYKRTSRADFSFYPSVTAYASSTSTSDCAAIIIGPLQLSEVENSSISLLQNELTDHGKIIIAQVDNNVALWSTNK